MQIQMSNKDLFMLNVTENTLNVASNKRRSENIHRTYLPVTALRFYEEKIREK